MTITGGDWTTLLGVLEQQQARIDALEAQMLTSQQQLKACVELCSQFEATIQEQSRHIQALESELDTSLTTLANKLAEFIPM
jgi:predicted  nucleic acid-binding Zn-ribbon protein